MSPGNVLWAGMIYVVGSTPEYQKEVYILARSVRGVRVVCRRTATR